jgi:hypothetical protein
MAVVVCASTLLRFLTFSVEGVRTVVSQASAALRGCAGILDTSMSVHRFTAQPIELCSYCTLHIVIDLVLSFPDLCSNPSYR